jgi:FAD-dependent oxidoreductase family protein
MAIVRRSASVRQSEAVGPDARRLVLESEEPLGFVGGQYIFADSGLIRPDGKPAKRAYSISSSDSEQRRFELVVKRLPGGLSSNFMHRLQLGDRLEFTGPYGKFVPPLTSDGHCVVIATDTGISAALGLMHGERFRTLLPATLLLWLRVDEEDFVSDDFVRQQLPRGSGEFRSRRFPPLHHPERLPVARALLGQILGAFTPTHARLSGDGLINYGLMADFAARGVIVGRDDVESFFNMPGKA